MKPYDEASRVKSGDEYDVTSPGWRRVSTRCQRAGYCAGIKRGIRRRSRRLAKQAVSA